MIHRQWTEDHINLQVIAINVLHQPTRDNKSVGSSFAIGNPV